MITLHRCSDLSPIRDLKADYLDTLIAPMDGMWETGFTDPAPHWEIRHDGERAGYHAANEEGTLLQFYVCPGFAARARELFDHVREQAAVREAVVSTIDPSFLSLCLDVHDSLTVHTYMYERHVEIPPDPAEAEGLAFRRVRESELERTVALQRSCLGGSEDMTEWLTGYSDGLIRRDELFALEREGEWLALGECRVSDTQEGVADLGMMVNPDHRRAGWATYVLQLLAADASARGLRPICSTTVENTGARKAITRAGFVSRHRVMNVTF